MSVSMSGYSSSSSTSSSRRRSSALLLTLATSTDAAKRTTVPRKDRKERRSKHLSQIPESPLERYFSSSTSDFTYFSSSPSSSRSSSFDLSDCDSDSDSEYDPDTYLNDPSASESVLRARRRHRADMRDWEDGVRTRQLQRQQRREESDRRFKEFCAQAATCQTLHSGAHSATDRAQAMLARGMSLSRR